MANTENYNFKKPLGSEFFNIVDQNDNWDIADATLKALSDGKIGKEIVTAANDFIIGSGNASVVKKTLAETKTILGVNAATESAKGVIELATAAETTAGSDSTRAVHPAGLKVELDKKVNKAGDTMTGALKFDRGASHVRNYKEVLHAYFHADNVGILKIAMPKNNVESMFSGKIKAYQYAGNNNSWELSFAAYSFVTNAFSFPTAKVDGSCPFSRVRFAYDGSKLCLLIGELNTSWSFATFSITDFLLAFGPNDGWETGWSAEIITSEAGLTNIVEAELQKPINGKRGTLTSDTTSWAPYTAVAGFNFVYGFSVPGLKSTDFLDIYFKNSETFSENSLYHATVAGVNASTGNDTFALLAKSIPLYPLTFDYLIQSGV